MHGRQGHLSVLSFLQEQGADIHKAATIGSTPVNVASQEGHLDVVRYLHASGVDINQARNSGATPVCIASSTICGVLGLCAATVLFVLVVRRSRRTA